MMKENEKNFVLYGAGNRCMYNMLPALFSAGILPLEVWDINAKNIGNICTLRVVEPHEGLPTDCLIIITIEDLTIAGKAGAYLNTLGYNNIIYGEKVNELLDFIKLNAATYNAGNRIDINSYAQKKRAFLFCVPDYGNLGDHAIADAAIRYFSKYHNVHLIEIPFGKYESCLPLLDEIITEEDLLLITGGGFLGSLWPDLESQVRRTVSRFKNNQIVVLPQTVYWEKGTKCQSEYELTRRTYEDHLNLTICARDNMTFELLGNYYPGVKRITAPDMTLAVTWQEYFKSVKRSGVELVFKTDKESVLTDDDKALIYKSASNIDSDIHINDTNGIASIPQILRFKLLRLKLAEFAGARLVITDRLHGLLFAVITETPCIAMNNCNHKLRETFKWIDDVPNVRFAENASDIENLIPEVLSAETKAYTARPELFSELDKCISEAVSGLQVRI